MWQKKTKTKQKSIGIASKSTNFSIILNSNLAVHILRTSQFKADGAFAVE